MSKQILVHYAINYLISETLAQFCLIHIRYHSMELATTFEKERQGDPPPEIAFIQGMVPILGVYFFIEIVS